MRRNFLEKPPFFGNIIKRNVRGALKPSNVIRLCIFYLHLKSFYVVVTAIASSSHLATFHHVVSFRKVLLTHFSFPKLHSTCLTPLSFANRLLSCKVPTLHIFATNGTGILFCFDMVMHGIVNKISKTNFSARFPLLHEIESSMRE